MNDVPKNFARSCSDQGIFVIDTDTVGDAEDKVTDEGVDEEANRQDRAQLLLVLDSDKIHQGYQDEQGRD